MVYKLEGLLFMDELEDLTHGPNKYMFYPYGSWGLGLVSRKASFSAPVIHYWPFKDRTFIMVLFDNCYIVFHFLMFLW